MLLASLNVQKTGGSAGWTTYGTFLVVVLSDTAKVRINVSFLESGLTFVLTVKPDSRKDTTD